MPEPDPTARSVLPDETALVVALQVLRGVLPAAAPVLVRQPTAAVVVLVVAVVFLGLLTALLFELLVASVLGLLIILLVLLIALFPSLAVCLLRLRIHFTFPGGSFPFLGPLIETLGILAPRLVVQFLLAAAVPVSTLFPDLLVASPLAPLLPWLLLVLPTPLSLHSASLLATVLSLLSVPLLIARVLLPLSTVGLSLVALLLWLAGLLSASWLGLRGSGLPTRLLVARGEGLVTGGLLASSLLSTLWAAGAASLSALSVELLLILPATRWWVLASPLGRLLTAELWALLALGLRRRLTSVFLRLSTAGGLILRTARL